MEADWEFEVGSDAAGLAAPVIEAAWAGFIDLEREPERARQLPEAAQLPGLAEALIRLNAAASPVRTSKCDLWPSLKAGEFDSDELDAPPGSSAYAMGCYIDLIPRGARQWFQPETAAAVCKELCRNLRAIPLRCCRADLIIRRALIAPDTPDQDPIRLGVTAYLTSCGESPPEAVHTLQGTLAALADAFLGHPKLE
jgi:hypothetical protein